VTQRRMYLMEYKIARDHPHWSTVDTFNKQVHLRDQRRAARAGASLHVSRTALHNASVLWARAAWLGWGVLERCVERSAVWMVVSDEKRATQFLPCKEPHDRRTGSAWHSLANPPASPIHSPPTHPPLLTLSPSLTSRSPALMTQDKGTARTGPYWVMSAC